MARVLTEYECALSGEIFEGLEEPEGELDDLPPGGARVTVEVRSVNPAWEELQRGIEAMTDQNLSSVPEDAKERARPLAALLARAQFAALAKETPRYLTETHELVVSPAHLGELTEFFGLEDTDTDEEDDDA